MKSGERQVAPTRDGIRRDHTARYDWAVAQLPPGSSVIDVACGVGYGARILADAGHRVTAIDRDAEAIEYARAHYDHANITWRCADADAVAGYERDSFDAAVSFETIEHIADPAPLLRALAAAAPLLLCSVPNEHVMPFAGQTFHYRHYTPDQMRDLLAGTGWAPTSWWGQEGAKSEVEPDISGRTLVVAARRAADNVVALAPELKQPARPRSVAIVGLGPSSDVFLDVAKRQGGRQTIADEIWVINSLGNVLAADLVFHMDDVRIQEVRAAALGPNSNIAQMLAWMRRHPGPIMTSRAHPAYPGLVEFPLEAVITDLGHAYFNNTAAYAIAYAIHRGFEEIGCFGLDFTYPRAHDAEKGRACCEFWLGVAHQRGIQLAFAETTSMFDYCLPFGDRLYGYDTLDVTVERRETGGAKVTMLPRPDDQLPTAAEIERRYDHSAHPNPIVQAQRAAAKPAGPDRPTAA